MGEEVRDPQRIIPCAIPLALSLTIAVYVIGVAGLLAATPEHLATAAAPPAEAGVVGCLVLVSTLPIASVLAGMGMFALGLAGRYIVLRRAPEAAE